MNMIPPATKNIAILGTTPTIESQIFQKRLDQIKVPYFIDQQVQDLVDQSLIEIKSQGVSIAPWNQLMEYLETRGIDTILLACTDLNLVLDEVECPFHIVDASLSLIDAIIDKWLELCASN